MNACDDQTEPLGEAPAIDPLGAIGRAGVLGLLSAADKITATKELAERQGQALRLIRLEHRSTVYTFPGAPTFPCCHGCTLLASAGSQFVGYPCATVAILDRLAL